MGDADIFAATASTVWCLQDLRAPGTSSIGDGRTPHRWSPHCPNFQLLNLAGSSSHGSIKAGCRSAARVLLAL
jgi:hypothetical protein